MKFLCVECDAQMASVQKTDPGDGSLALLFRCPRCRREIAMLTNPMETQMVSSLCVSVGDTAATAPEPFAAVGSHLDSGGEGPHRDDGPAPSWSEAAETRLARIPGFVRGMVRRLYADWAREHRVAVITVEMMDQARSELGLEELQGL